MPPTTTAPITTVPDCWEDKCATPEKKNTSEDEDVLVLDGEEAEELTRGDTEKTSRDTDSEGEDEEQEELRGDANNNFSPGDRLTAADFTYDNQTNLKTTATKTRRGGAATPVQPYTKRGRQTGLKSATTTERPTNKPSQAGLGASFNEQSEDRAG